MKILTMNGVIMHIQGNCRSDLIQVSGVPVLTIYTVDNSGFATLTVRLNMDNVSAYWPESMHIGLSGV
jgi:hypothetical protein